ncbi:MAG: (2Fe-2S)-binding protein [Phenylobacterium sp.]
MATTLDINGRPVTVQADPSTPLLWVLRDELMLTGTKYGCGIAQCGACTVLSDGQPIRSCQTPIAAVTSAKIATIESLGGAHPLQVAWVKNDVPQCGYCQSGQLMSAAALLARNPKPSDADIDAAMSGNICRCGTYQRIHAAIREASGQPMVKPVTVNPAPLAVPKA